MSAVNKPNKNFLNETMTHVPYKELVSDTRMSLYDKFMRPKDGKARAKKSKSTTTESVKTLGFDVWFNK